MRDKGGGIVGNDGVDLGGDELVPLIGRVGGPGDHLESGFVGALYLFLRDQQVVGGDDAGAGFAGEILVVLEDTLVEGGETDGRIEFLHGVEGAEVEGLDDDAGLEFVAVDGIVNEAGEFFGRWGQLGLGFEDFGFDVVFEFAFGSEGEDFFECRDTGSGDGLLFGEIGVLFGAAVPGAKFGEGHLADGSMGLAAGTDGGVHGWVVRHDEDVVLRYGEIEFENVDADGDGVLEGGQGVFGALGASAAMAVDEDFRGGGGEGNHYKQQQNKSGGSRWGYHVLSIAKTLWNLIPDGILRRRWASPL